MSYLKSFRFWVVFLAALYTASGFLLLPWLITEKIPPLLQEKTGLHVSIQKAYTNPFTFQVQLDEIQIKDQDNNPALSIEQIFINYELLALFEKKVLFSQFRISTPKLTATIGQNGKLNLNNLVDLPQTKSEQSSKTDASLPLVFLEKFYIENGEISFEDLRKKTPFRFELGPYDFNAYDISTALNAINSHSFGTSFKNGGELYWEGGMSIRPLKLYGKLNLTDFSLPKFYKYALPGHKAHLQSAYLDLEIPYNIDMSNKFELLVEKANVSLSNLRVSSKSSKNMLIKAPQINLKNIDFHWPEQSARAEKFTLKNPSVFARLTQDKDIDLLSTFLPPQSKESKKVQKSANKNSQKSFTFMLKEFTVQEGDFEFTDTSLPANLVSKLSQINLRIKKISSDKNLPIEAKLQSRLNRKTDISAQGEFLQADKKLTSSISIKDFDLNFYAPYATPFTNIDIQNGLVDLNTQVEAKLPKSLKLHALSDVKIKALKLDTPDQRTLLSWESLALNAIDYTHEPMSLNVGSIDLKKPYTRLHISKDGTTNLSNLIKDDANNKDEPSEKKEKSPLHVEIGPISLMDGSSDFSDLSLPFPFETHIHDLNGDISALHFFETKPSKISLEGKIDKYGYTEITGELLPFKVKKSADINILFKNIDLPTLTPYSGKFVGYAIESGKLSMDLNYHIEDATLEGDNKINIDTLTLGEKVESPDAANLPLKLAVALLKDSKGQIDIDLPVQGNMNNPEFSYGGVVWQAIGNLITGIVTAPFRFLGNMLGIDGEDLKSIDFALGSAKLINTEQEKLANLEKIMGKRPNIKLAIQGSYDEVLDSKALQKEKFSEILQKTEEEITGKDEEKDTYFLALKKLYLEEFSQEEYEKLRDSFIDEKSEKLNVSSFNEKVKELLTQRIEIKKESLLELAHNRANTVKEALHVRHKIEPKRLEIKEPIQNEAKRDRWVEVKLDITN